LSLGFLPDESGVTAIENNAFGNPTPLNLHPNPQGNPTHQTRNSKQADNYAENLNSDESEEEEEESEGEVPTPPQPCTLNPQPSPRNPQPSTFNPHPWTLPTAASFSSTPSTLYPLPSLHSHFLLLHRLLNSIPSGFHTPSRAYQHTHTHTHTTHLCPPLITSVYLFADVFDNSLTPTPPQEYDEEGSLAGPRARRLEVTPKPQPLNPTPCTLHLAPCSLQPAPDAIHPSPYIFTIQLTTYNIQHTTYDIHLTPYTLHLTPRTLHHTPYILHPTPNTLHLTPYTLHPAP